MTVLRSEFLQNALLVYASEDTEDVGRVGLQKLNRGHEIFQATTSSLGYPTGVSPPKPFIFAATIRTLITFHVISEPISRTSSI